MSSTTTGNLALTVGADREKGLGAALRQNFEDIDAAISAIQNGTVTESSWADGDTTPDISSGQFFNDIGWTGGATVTALDNGSQGDVVYFRATTAFVTIDGTLTKTGQTIPLVSGDELIWKHDGTAFEQIGGTVGLGQFRKVDPGNQIGDWIAQTQTTFTDVDVSDDGVRKGAVAVLIALIGSSMTTGVDGVRARRNGAAETGAETLIGDWDDLENHTVHPTIPLDNDAIFEARVDNGAGAGGTFDAYVRGYWI